MKPGLHGIYKKLFAYFGPQHWWPAESSFEVMVGAILTQNTNWQNAELAIGNLKRQGLLDPRRLFGIPKKNLARFIRPAGYYNIKAARLRNFLTFFLRRYQGDCRKMRGQETAALRQELLSVSGIGPETADSILLYALEKPVFVVDAYTKRIFLRHKIIAGGATYEAVQKIFMQNLKTEVKLFNEYHALLAKLGKDFCRKSQPLCKTCPLGE
jgi:endonuclease-3 related protein